MSAINALSAASSTTQQNGAPKAPAQSETLPVLHLLPMNGTFEHKMINVPYAPEIIRVGRQTNQKTVPTAHNGYFDSKVLSRQHAEIWADRDGKIWIKDVKSSNGTFVNGKRLSPENKDSEPHIIKEQDVLELGIDIVSEDQKTVVHHKVAARVEHAGFSTLPHNLTELTFGEMDPSLLQLGQPGLQGNRSRAGSQGANGMAGRYPGIVTNNNMMQAGYNPKWITPVTIETIVKRINTELKAARIQANDLKHTSHFVDAVVANEKSPPPPPPARASPSSPRKSFDGHKLSQFSPPPPGPPPTQPLPETPASAIANGNMRAKMNDIQPLLRRDTERPLVPNKSQSPSKATGEKMQIRNLVDALTTAQREILTQGDKLKETEEALSKERAERKAVEERTAFLESGSQQAPDTAAGIEPGKLDSAADTQRQDAPSTLPITSTSSTTDAHVSRLESLITSMRTEMEALREQLTSSKTRVEEAEDSSRRDRKSLIEMVESIKRREERARKRREQRSAKHHIHALPNGVIDKKSSMLSEKQQQPNGVSAHMPQRRRSSGSDDDDDFLDFEADDNLDGTLDRAMERLRKDGHTFTNSNSGTNETNMPSVADLQALGKTALQNMGIASLSSAINPEQSTHSDDKNTQSTNSTILDHVPLPLPRSSNDATSSSNIDHTTKPSSPTDPAAPSTSTSSTLTKAQARTSGQSQTALAEAAPYASLIGVVLLGVGMMAWLNGWQKIERV